MTHTSKRMYEGIKDIYGLLAEERLKEALVQMEGICASCNDWQLRTKIEELQTAYGYMLQYARMGMQDPNRKTIRQQFIRQAYELTEWADTSLHAQASGGLYYQHLRTFKERPALTYAELQVRLESYTEDIGTVSLFYADEQRRQAETQKICQRHELALDELFNKVWTSRPWSEAEAGEAEGIIASVLVSANDKAVLVSAVTLSLLHLFDERKVCFLMNACKHEDTQVCQRALVGVVIAFSFRKDWMKRYPALLSQISLLKDDEAFCRDLHTVQMQLLMTRETDKISKKMHEEIIPGMMKNPQIRKNSIRFEESEDEEDRNPEWEEWIDKSGIGEKIRELGELQMQGADVYMSTFAQLKSYPFFSQVSHWFYPFDFHHTDLLSIAKDFGAEKLSPLTLIVHSDTFCNSDKYSFCLTFAQMSPNLKEKNIRALQMQAQMDEEQKAMLQEMIDRPRAAKSISRQYIQDLYRFFKIWGNKHPGQETDIFGLSLDLWKNPYTTDIFKDTERLKEIADFLFQKERWEEAEDVYLSVIKKGTETSEIYQKLGYICQKTGDDYGAIGYLERADILTPDNLWTLKHLAQCHKRRAHYEEAIEYFKKIEKIQPDNLKVALHLGECFIKAEEYEKALPYLHKVEYLEKNPDNARRAIGWCSFCIGKYEDALRYYNLLLQKESPLMQDWLNVGHVYLAMKQTPQALLHYAKAQDLCKSHTEFMEIFMEDKKTLLAFVSEEDLRILLDLLV